MINKLLMDFLSLNMFTSNKDVPNNIQDDAPVKALLYDIEISNGDFRHLYYYTIQ